MHTIIYTTFYEQLDIFNQIMYHVPSYLALGKLMKFKVLCLLNRPLKLDQGQRVQNRAIVVRDFDVNSPEQFSVEVAVWLGGIMRNEPCSTEVLSLSHTRID